MTSGETKAYSVSYIEQCFETWFSLGETTNFLLLQDRLPENSSGRKPSIALLRSMKESSGWVERADALNAKAIEKVEHQLIDQRADMLSRQAKDDYDIALKAREHILESGFDTSASAVSAYFKAVEDERIVRGVSEFMVKISKMPSEEIIKEAAKLLKRNSEVIDLVAEEMAAEEVDSADISGDTS